MLEHNIITPEKFSLLHDKNVFWQSANGPNYSTDKLNKLKSVHGFDCPVDTYFKTGNGTPC